MLDALLEMFDGRGDERGRGAGPAQRGGIRGLLSRIFGGDDGDDERAPGQRGCCAGDDEVGDGTRSHQTSGRATRQRDQDQRDGGFDFGD